ncbi:endonuclease/exonuclease/phosphatase family protein [Streptomyces sp. DSM 42041]|uniref:Endonuclease/exonuclease/phosphatase family protein n=2 Tax=Streptomyces hazeniae TaxID=3075538 RepID=A0ABU2NSI2_9ACTN|nr:endonuclease/exonuclease/phosphatase family protein [Streptomyces sp. DSM 42041]MDT0379566.1 endonuclease/exonuclease/phosphatase family protein [Streptomyces sp. DSM 42041]
MARAFMTEAERTDGAGHGRPRRSFRGPRGGSSGDRGGWSAPGMWRRGVLLAALALGLTALLLLHARVPNVIGNLGSLWETFLPWGGLLIPVLLVGAVVRRSATALVALLAPAVAWWSLFGGLISDKTGSGGELTVVTHNVSAANPDPGAAADQLAASGADVLALQEIAGDRIPLYERELAAAYPHHVVIGTIGLWSKEPLQDARHVDIDIGWKRALRATVQTPQGDVAVYVAHLPSVRVEFRSGFTAGQRDDAARLLGREIADDPVGRVVLLGDLNGTMNDRALAPVTSQMRSTQGAAGDGMGFSWPASFPMARIDQIMVKDLDPVSSWSLPGTGSDHLPVAASVNLP